MSSSDKPEVRCDVAVLGGGLAGLAVATRLARRGLTVVCIEPRTRIGTPVGESLDWSAPQLLEELGFPVERLVRDGIATRKRHIRVHPDGEAEFAMEPERWFERPPLRLALETVHLDRERFDAALLEEAERAGVVFRRERVREVHVDADRVVAIETCSARVRAKRYVDAAGRARLFARAFEVPRVEYGEPKVSAWTYVNAPLRGAGTTLHFARAGGYLNWAWEIPVANERQSFGLTLTTTELQRRLARAANVEEVLRDELARHAHLRGALADAEPLPVHTRSFRCYVHARTCGPNWFLVGESAAMLDPLTSNGFSFAVGFGADAADAIVATLELPELPRDTQRNYDVSLRRMAHAFNDHIERIAYRPMMRDELGTRLATRVYVVFGFFANSIYRRLRPRGVVSAQALRAVLAGFWMRRFVWACIARFVWFLGRGEVRYVDPHPRREFAGTQARAS